MKILLNTRVKINPALVLTGMVRKHKGRWVDVIISKIDKEPAVITISKSFSKDQTIIEFKDIMFFEEKSAKNMDKFFGTETVRIVACSKSTKKVIELTPKQQSLLEYLKSAGHPTHGIEKSIARGYTQKDIKSMQRKLATKDAKGHKVLVSKLEAVKALEAKKKK